MKKIGVLLIILCISGSSFSQFGKLKGKLKKKNKTEQTSNPSNSESSSRSNTSTISDTKDVETATMHLSNAFINTGSYESLGQSVDWCKPVYGVMDLGQPLSTFKPRVQKNKKYLVRLYVTSEGGYYGYLNFYVPKSALDNNYVVIDMVPEEQHATTDYEYPAMNMGGFLRDMKNSSERITFSIGEAKASFNADVSGCDRQELWQKARKGSEAAASNFSISALPEPFSKAGVVVPELPSSTIGEMIKTAYGSKVSEVLKIVTVGNPEWRVNTNSVGIPKNRYVAGTRTMATYKGTDGNCYFLDELYLEQEYAGGGTYGPYRIPRIYGKDFPGTKLVDCDMAR